MMSSKLAKLIKQEIARSCLKAIPFQRFMELALYHPTEGYYCKEHSHFGKQGDFFTNVQVGSLFSRLIASQFCQFAKKQNVDKWAIVEMGAGDGHFMREIISFFDEQQGKHVDFYLVERGRKRIETVDPAKAKWVDTLDEVPPYSFAIVFSNELVDAFPVHRLQKKKGEIKEIFVTWDERTASFQEVLHDCSTSELADHAEEMVSLLAEEQTIEVNLEAKYWLKNVANWLKEGYLVTIDYGGSTEDLLFRPTGTMRYFQKHRLLDHSYDKVGEVDMTASVDFTKLQSWGKELGLQTMFFGPQLKFLLNTDLSKMLNTVQDMKAFKQLVHPDGMGESFQVLVQQKITPKK